jgi:hypothetical protein
MYRKPYVMPLTDFGSSDDACDLDQLLHRRKLLSTHPTSSTTPTSRSMKSGRFWLLARLTRALSRPLRRYAAHLVRGNPYISTT